MRATYYHKAIAWISLALKLQLFVTITTLPLLIVWGLSIPLISIIINIVAAPFVPFYLGLCSLFFCAALISPLHPACSMLLEQPWLWARTVLSLPYGKALLTSLPLIYLPTTLFIAILYSFFLFSSVHQQKTKKVLFLLISLLFLSLSIAFFTPLPPRTTLSKKTRTGYEQKVVFTLEEKSIRISDKGYISRARNKQECIIYKVAPHIRQHYPPHIPLLLENTKTLRAVASLLSEELNTTATLLTQSSASA